MTIVENVLVGGVETSFYTVLYYLAGSGWTLQLLDLARRQERESNKVLFMNQTGKEQVTGVWELPRSWWICFQRHVLSVT